MKNTRTQQDRQAGSNFLAGASPNGRDSKTKILFRHKIKAVLVPSKAIHFYEHEEHGLHSGVNFKNKQYITHSKLDHEESAVYTFMQKQKVGILLLLGVIIYALLWDPVKAVGGIIAFLTVIYFIDSLFTLYLVKKNLNFPAELQFSDEELANIKDEDLPVYTILAPLYKEFEVLPDFVENIQKLDYPHEKLDVMLLLEENDTDTIALAEKLKLPSYIRTIIVPHSYPKTKPKACNYGLWHAKGEYVVIYDAEDRMDPLQLKKAYLAFRNSAENVVCVQAKLNYFNSNQNLLTRFFTAEYSLWFDVILPGFQSINTVIPLGGTSNHFKVDILKKLHGWDAFNVTEDADLGARLFKKGYKTTIIDSVTWEEANSNVKNWIRQRSRWIKGYLQTYLVHMRRPLQFLRHKGIHWFIFQLIIGMRITFIVINPILWATTIAYFAFNKYVGETIESLYPAPVFYMAVFSLVFGNFVYLYNYMIGLAKRGKWNLIKFVYLVPLYWLLMAAAAWMAIYQLFVKPHHWEKTNHGLVKDKKREWKFAGSLKRVDWAFALITFGLFLLCIQLGLTFVVADWSVLVIEGIFYVEVVLAIVVTVLLGIRTFGIFQKKLTDKGYIGESGADYSTNAEQGYIKVFHKHISKDEFGALIFIAAGGFASILNYLYSAYLARQLNVENFGIISLTGSFLFITTIPLGAVARAVAQKVAYFMGKDKTPITSFWKNVRFKVFLASAAFTIVWAIALPAISSSLRIESIFPLLMISPIFILNAVYAVNYGYITGVMRFYTLSILLIIEALSKLLISWYFVETGQAELVYLAIPLSLAFTLFFAEYFISKLPKNVDSSPERNVFPTKNFVSFMATRFSVIAYLTFDVVLAKHFLTSYDAGLYAIIALAGKMIYFVGTIIAEPLIPLVSKQMGEAKKTYRTFIGVFSLFLAASTFVYLIIGYYGSYSAPILLGQKANEITSLLPIYGFGILCFCIASFLIMYRQAQNKHFYAVISLILTGVQIIIVSYNHTTLEDFVSSMAIVGVLNIVVISLSVLFERQIITVVLNLSDVFDIFSDKVGLDSTNPNLKILIFNWRDTKHVWAGGAEVYIQEIAKLMVKQGHQVTLICGNDQLSQTHEIIDGVHVVRHGGFYTVYLMAPIYYLLKLRGKYDVVIDSENGIPFFTPLFVKEPVVGLLHHVHQEIIIEQLALAWYKKPVAHIAKILETKTMPHVYKNVQMVTVSNSSLAGMEKIGLGKNKPIEIVNPGVEIEKFRPAQKTDYPTILYLGRIKPYKSIEVVIKAIATIIADIPDVVFNIAGYGEHLPDLEKIVDKMGLEKHVNFLGKVDEDEKVRLMSQSWVFVYPSLWEGWGISVIEANASGTPVVASNVPGLRDSVSNPHSGYLVEYGDVRAFEHRLKLLINDHDLRERLSKESIEWAKNFTWESSTEKMLNILKNAHNEHKTKKEDK
jgi:glycosyltransferase involved in cell wall biosynthesis/cellulose synthase/poly-beta-1,6-N-acetylglucosamine synthase-like glycosyltransferase/O-antigen/teichoic acid export membrane protein